MAHAASAGQREERGTAAVRIGGANGREKSEAAGGAVRIPLGPPYRTEARTFELPLDLSA